MSRRAFVAVIALALVAGASGCTSSKPRATAPAPTESPRADVTLRTDKQRYAPGDEPTVTLENRSSARVGYNICFAFLELERMEDGVWTVQRVNLGPGGNFACTSELRNLPPSQSATTQVYLSPRLQPGTYRLTHMAEINRSRQKVVSNAFEVS